MKCNEFRPGFELVSPCSFPTTITITPRAPPKSDKISIAKNVYLFDKHFFLIQLYACGLTIIDIKMDPAKRVQILDEAICISCSHNSIGKDMNPRMLSLNIGK